MKRLIITIIAISVFFVGLGTLADKAGATLKSDDKALELIRAARLAIGGDAAIANVRSMTIAGKLSRTRKVNGADVAEQGETDIALQLPNRFSKMVRFNEGSGAGTGEKIVDRRVIVVGDGDEAKALVRSNELPTGDGTRKVIVREIDPANGEPAAGDGAKFIITKDGDKVMMRHEGGVPAGAEKEMIIRHAEGGQHAEMRQNELLRTTLGLLLTAPDGMDVSYTYGGESSVDGTPCNVVNAQFGGSAIKLFLGRDSNLPVMISYIGSDMPEMVHFRTEVPAGTDLPKDTVIYTRKTDAAVTSEIQLKFSDYRSVGGVQLPYRWTKSVNGADAETLDVVTYDINPANIADRFAGEKVMVRTRSEPK